MIDGRFDNFGEIGNDSDEPIRITSNRFNNFGLISASYGGVQLESPISMTNRGTIELRQSVFSARNLFNHFAGSIQGSGSIFVSDVVENFGHITPGGLDTRFGVLEVSSVLDLNRPGTLTVDLGLESGEFMNDLVLANSAILDGTLEIQSDADLEVMPYEPITILQTNVSLTGHVQ